MGFEIQNQTTTKMAVIMGSYAEGYGRDDLVSYGRDVSTRPNFLESPEIYEVAPDSSREITVERGPGRYFTICMDTPSTMIVLDDLVIGANDDPDRQPSPTDDAGIGASSESTGDEAQANQTSASDAAEPLPGDGLTASASQ